jgi:hypothetical protein
MQAFVAKKGECAGEIVNREGFALLLEPNNNILA